MATQLSRRNFLRLSAVTASGALLAACQPAAAPAPQAPPQEAPAQEAAAEPTAAPASSDVVNLRLAEGSWVGPEGLKFWTDTIIKKFEEENPGIKVTYEDAEAPDYADKLYTMAVAGEAPDAFFIWWSGGMMEKGQLLQLDEYFDKEYMADFFPGNIAGQVLDGKLYGVPKYISTVCLGYNKDILDEAGVAVPDGTWTWDKYLDAIKKCTKRDADGNVTQWGTYVSQDYLPHYVWMNGGEWMNGDLFGTKPLFAEPKGVEALKYNYDFIYDKEPVSARPGDIADHDWSNVFSTGRVAFMESHSWTVTNYLRENNFKWGFTDMVNGPDGKKAGLTFTNGYSIFQGTKHVPESVKLVKFLTDKWAQTEMCTGILGLQPARRSLTSVWDTQSMGAKEGQDVSAFSRVMEVARLTPEFKDAQKIAEIWTPVWEQIWITNEIGLEEGVQLLADRINEYYASAS
jgi:multiple sugar transport system substrate-binding protein